MRRIGSLLRHRATIALLAIAAISAAVAMPALAAPDSPPSCDPHANVSAHHGASAADDAIICTPTADGATTVSYSVTSYPQHGGAFFLDPGTGAFSWTPDVSYVGPDSFTYTASDDLGNTTTEQTVELESTDSAPTCHAVNLGEVAHSQSATPLAADCSDPDGDSLTYDSASPSASKGQGSVNPFDGTLSYSAGADKTGADSFGYRANDGALDSNAALASVTITNNAPVCQDVDLGSGVHEVQNGGFVDCSDPDGDAMTFAKAGTDAAHGTATVASDGTITYTPNTHYVGPDTFHYRATDSLGATSAIQAVTVNVTNSAPSCYVGGTQETHWNTALDMFPSCGDPDPSDNPLTIQVTTQPTHGAVTYNAVQGKFTYTPADKYVGADSFGFSASDGVATSTYQQDITVSNNAPSCTGNSETIRVGKKATLSLNCSDYDFFVGSYPDQPAPAVVGSPVNGSVTNLKYDKNTGTMTADFTPTAIGPASFQFKLGDGQTESAAATESITVTANHAPQCFTNQTVAVAPNGQFSVQPFCFDQDLQDSPLAYTITQQPSHGTLDALVDGQTTYHAGGTSPIRDQFTLQASDGSLTGDYAQPVHIATTPFCTPGPTLQMRPGQQKSTAMDCTNAPNSFSQLTYSVKQGPTQGTLLGFSQFSSSVSYKANANGSGADSYTLTVSNGSTSSDATQNVNVSPSANDAPTCFDNGAPGQRVFNDRANVLFFSGLCFDPDADPLTYRTPDAGGASPAHGQLTTSDASLAFTPDSGYTGSDSFSYVANDDHGGTSNTSTYTVTVVPPEKPTCSVPSPISVRPNKSKTVSVFCTSAQNDPQTYAVDTQPTAGSVTQPFGNTFNQFKYTAGPTEGPDTFKVKATNKIGTSDPVTAAVTISASANDAPSCISNGSFNPQSVGKTGDTVLPLATVCSDADGDPLQYTRTSQPTHGTVDAGPAASLSYHPDGSYLGPDSFQFKATDDHNGTSAVITYFINVVPSVAPTCTQLPTLNVRPGAGKSLTFNCSDPNNGQLTYKIVSQPTIGTLTPQGDTTSPARQFSAGPTATDGAFTYKVSSPTGGDSQIYTQNLHIAADANDAPSCVSNAGFPQTVVTGRQTVLQMGPGFPATCTDPDGDAMTFTASPLTTAHGTVVNQAGVVKYTSNQGYTGPDTISYTASDGHGGTTPVATFNVSVEAATPPTCTTPPPISVRPGQQRVLFFSCDDSFSDTLTYKIGTSPTKGTLSPLGDSASAQRTYTAGNTEGSDSFTYLASSINGDATPVTQQITISSTANESPQCFANSFSPPSVPKGTATVLAPDCFDPDGDPLHYVKVSDPTHGTVTVTNNGQLSYQSDANYTGLDSFTYKAQDDHSGESSVTTFTLNVVQATNPSCTQLATIAIRPGQQKAFSLNCTDPVNATVTYVIDSQPAKGTLAPTGSSTNPLRTFTADGNASGADSFSYHATSANGSSATYVQSFTISPTANSDPTCASNQATPFGVSTGQLTQLAPQCFDADSDPLSFEKVTDPAHGTVSVSNDGKLSYQSAANYTGIDSFTYRAHDDHSGQSAVQTFYVNVTHTNAKPTCTQPATLHAVAGEPTPVSVACSDADGDPLTAVPVTGPTHGQLGTASFSNGSVSATYTPDSTYSGVDAATFKVNDGTVDSDPVTLNISVNRRPTCQSVPDADVVNHTAKDISVTCADADSSPSPLTLVVDTDGQHGHVTVGSGKVTYTPTGDYAGPDTFKVKASDGRDQSAPQAVNVTVAADTAPVCDAVAGQSAVKHAAATDIALSCSDAENDTMTLAKASDPAHGTVTIAGTTATYTPNATYSGPDSFTYKATDGHGGESAPATVSVTVASNNLPTCADQTVAVKPHTAKGFSIQCTDADGQALTLSVVDQPAHGTLLETRAQSTGDKAVTYTPSGDYAGPDTFTFKANDGEGDSPKATVTLNVAANTAPACDAESADVAHDTAKDVTLSCSDAEGDALTLAKGADPAHGTVTISGTTATYKPAAGYSGGDSFTYKATDGHGGESAPATVNVTVAAAPAVTPTPTPTPSPSPSPSPTPTGDGGSGALAAKLAAFIGRTFKVNLKKPTVSLGTQGGCSNGCVVTIKLGSFGKLTLTIPAGARKPVMIKLNSAATKKLKKGKPVKVALTVGVTDGAGGSATKSGKITLKKK